MQTYFDFRTLFSSVLDNMDQGVLVVRDDLSVPLLNVRATELIDVPREFADAPPNFTEILAYQVKTGAITENFRVSWINDFLLHGRALRERPHYTRRTPSGRWLDVRTTTLPEGGFIRTFTDQTERYRVNDEKDDSETAYKALFHNAAVGIYRSSLGGQPLRVNPEFVAMNGYHSETDMLLELQDIAAEWYVDGDRRAEFKRIMARDGRVTEFESEVYRHLTRERIWVSETAWPLRGEDGTIIGYEGTVTDITERKRLESALVHAAAHDPMTGLPNRASFHVTMGTALDEGGTHYLAYMDLDRFKQVNDTRGHGCGDALLKAVAERFRDALRNTDNVFRMGGDEFAVLLTHTDARAVRQTLDRIVTAMSTPFTIDGVTVQIGVSVGIVECAGGTKAADLLHLADTALYRAKQAGGGTVKFATREVVDTRRRVNE